MFSPYWYIGAHRLARLLRPHQVPATEDVSYLFTDRLLHKSMSERIDLVQGYLKHRLCVLSMYADILTLALPQDVPFSDHFWNNRTVDENNKPETSQADDQSSTYNEQKSGGNHLIESFRAWSSHNISLDIWESWSILDSTTVTGKM